MEDITVVLGVDQRHIKQLAWVWPTWMRFKPEIVNIPLVVFHDWMEVQEKQIHTAIKGHTGEVMIVPWPPKEAHTFRREGFGKFYEPQRVKMITGFVYVAAQWVRTKYWMKIDTDTVATKPGGWIKEGWFEGSPAIISQGWHYTKPPRQMLDLDDWVAKNDVHPLNKFQPLKLAPELGANKVRHKRIISWCALFNTAFTRDCALMATNHCVPYHLPVPSQDGYMWYCAARCNLGIIREDMRKLGWKHCSRDRDIRNSVAEVMGDDG